MIMLPQWTMDGGPETLKARLADPAETGAGIRQADERGPGAARPWRRPG